MNTPPEAPSAVSEPPMSWNRILLCLLLTSLLLPAAQAGTQEDPEVTDPNNDAVAVGGACTPDNALCAQLVPVDGAADARDEAEIVAAWITEPDNATFAIHVETVAYAASTTYTVGFNVTPTQVSLHTGLGENQSYSFTVSGDTATDAPANTTVAVAGNIVSITLTRNDTKAVGGDSITELAVATSFQSSKSGTAPVTRTVTTTDSASGQTAPFNLTRPPIVPALALAVLGGSITQTLNGTSQTTMFTTNQVTTAGPNATVTFTLQVTNSGTDPDNATIELFDPTSSLAADNVNITILPATVATLLPGQAANVTITATLTEAAVGEHPILLQATSGRGAIGAAAMQVTVPAPPPPPPTTTTTTTGPATNTGTNTDDGEREAALGLGFLSPMAEAMGFDKAFGDYAELVLLALLLLLLVLIVFLIIFFATRGAVVVEIEPRVLSARPGEKAEFSVAIRNKRGRSMDAIARFEGDPAWRTGLVFGEAQLTQPDTDAQIGLGPKDRDSGTRLGKLQVTVPANAHDDETDVVTVAVSALSESGRPVKTRSARAKVRAIGSAPVKQGDLPMRLASVDHVPEEPVAGEIVATTARIENDSEADTLDLRVVLNVDGNDVQEQNVVVPPRSARAVVFRWEAPQGSSKVRVRVYPQD